MAMKEALELLGKVTGWGNMVRPIIGRDEIHTFISPDESVGSGQFVFLCGVTVCGAGDAIRARGQGSTLVAAMLDAAHKVVAYHKSREEWHRIKREAAERAMIQTELGDGQ
jgi:hypothetical protein